MLTANRDPLSWEDAMKFRISGVLAIAGLALASLLGSAQSLAQNAYITNYGDNTVSVIATATNTVIATIPVGNDPCRRGGDPGRQQGLCHERRPRPHRVGDRHARPIR